MIPGIHRPVVAQPTVPPPLYLLSAVSVPIRMEADATRVSEPGVTEPPLCRGALGEDLYPGPRAAMDAPWGVCAFERQYRDRQASRRHPRTTGKEEG